MEHGWPHLSPKAFRRFRRILSAVIQQTTDELESNATTVATNKDVTFGISVSSAIRFVGLDVY
jgi:hypothetical protein